MKYSMRYAVYEEMLAALKRPPNDMEDLLFQASQHAEVARIAPFYGFYLYPHEWLHYSLQKEDPLAAELNLAMLIALDAPTIEADPKMLLYFSIAASSHNSEVNEQSLSVAFKTTMLFQTFIYLQNKVSHLEQNDHFSMRKYKNRLKQIDSN
ncbi:hypothetical protein [Sinobaca sp. H24]|uniref:hypothetical protein n=1 Tax=Sinobaca sp. H24 TaxID=2923376 RepID=UPI00207A5F8B|nr:hypothetical protein [Sinobaca sp. H24]